MPLSSPSLSSPLALAEGFPAVPEAAWRALVAKALKGAEFDSALVARTLDGLRIEPLYTEAPAAPPLEGRAGPWQIVSRPLAAEPSHANAEILADLEGGATAIELPLAAPGLAGLPPRHDAIRGALAGVHLEMVPVSLAAGDQYLGALQSLLALWEEAGVVGARRQGALNADPLGHLARTGALEAELWTAIDVLGQSMARNVGLSPNLTLLLADGRPYHDAGASEAEELAVVLATFVEYLKAMDREGAAPAQSLPRFEVALAADADFLLTIAKLRAARRLIARLAGACGAAEAAAHVRIVAETSRRMLTRLDPHVNILRATIACAAAAIAGADRIAVLPHMTLLGLPDAQARRIARNLQIVLMEESRLDRVADPAAGSHAFESLTHALAGKAWSLLQDIERKGGMAEALQSGFVAEGIARTAAERAELVATGRLELTGVSAFADLVAPSGAAEPLPAPAPIERAGTRIETLPLRRPAEPFERLRERAARLREGAAVTLLSLGPDKDHASRIELCRNVLAAGGIGVEAVSAPAQARSPVVVLCGSDAACAAEAEDVARVLKAAGVRLVALAARPGERKAAYEAAGIGAYLFQGCDRIALLSQVAAQLERRS